jgi:hypothetical protein
MPFRANVQYVVRNSDVVQKLVVHLSCSALSKRCVLRCVLKRLRSFTTMPAQKKGARLVTFLVSSLPTPYVDNDCNYQVADLFAVDIDLSRHKEIRQSKVGRHQSQCKGNNDPSLVQYNCSPACQTSCYG